MSEPDYKQILNQAKDLRKKNTNEARNEIIVMLQSAMTIFPDILAIGDELVLAYKGNSMLIEAIRVLKELDKNHRYVGEETLCRWGSVLRLRAMEQLEAGVTGAAIQELMESENYFCRCYEQHQTHYPRINQLTTRLTRASLLAAQEPAIAEILLKSVQTDAEEMLAHPTMWSAANMHEHDTVWAPASQGEANLLLQRYSQAEKAYGRALKATAPNDFSSRASMAKQVREVLLPAFGRLGITVTGALAEPDIFFAPIALPAPAST